MPKESDSGVETVSETAALEQTETPTESPSEGAAEENTKGLSLRDALEVALEASKSPEKEGSDAEKRSPERVDSAPEKTRDEGSSKVSRKAARSPRAPDDSKPLEAPAEWDAEDKELFAKSSKEQQVAALKLHQKRNATREEIQRAQEAVKREAAELQWVKDIEREVTPFLKVRGDKAPTHQQIINALKLVNELDRDPTGTVAAILQARGKQVPAELLEKHSDSGIDEKIAPLQKEVEYLRMKAAQEEQQRLTGALRQSWATFESEKNAAGEVKYPDIIGNDDKALKLAGNIGLLCGGQTELSKQFIALTKARIPDLTLPRLYEEAYRYYGGRVVDASDTKPSTQKNQEHLAISQRAAASKPSRVVPSSPGGTVKKYKTYREAAEAALRELNSD